MLDGEPAQERGRMKWAWSPRNTSYVTSTSPVMVSLSPALRTECSSLSGCHGCHCYTWKLGIAAACFFVPTAPHSKSQEASAVWPGWARCYALVARDSRKVSFLWNCVVGGRLFLLHTCGILQTEKGSSDAEQPVGKKKKGGGKDKCLL